MTINQDGYIDIAKKIGTKISGNAGFQLQLQEDSLFAQLYVGNGMTKRYIDLLVDDMTRQWINIPEDTEGKILYYMKNIKTKSEIKNGLKNSKLFGGSLIFIVIEDGKEPNEPVDIENIKSIKKLKLFSKKYVTIENFNYYTDLTSSNFGEPEYFTITTKSGQIFTIHESRCLLFRGEYYPCDELPISTLYDEYWGLSILQSLYEMFEDYGLALQALLKTFSKFNIDTLKIKNLMQLLSNPDGQKQLEARTEIFDLAKSISTTLVLDSEESFEVINQSLQGVADTFTKVQETVAAMTGIPSNILMGTPVKGLNANGNSEIRIYYDKIKSDQEEELLPQLEKLVSYIIKAKDLNISKLDKYTIEFNSLWQSNDQEKVDILNKAAQSDQIYIQNGVLGAEEVRESRFGSDNFSLNTKLNNISK